MEKLPNTNSTAMKVTKAFTDSLQDVGMLLNVTQSSQVSRTAVSRTSAYLLTSKSPRCLSTATGTSVHVRVLMFVRDSYINIPSVQVV